VHDVVSDYRVISSDSLTPIRLQISTVSDFSLDKGAAGSDNIGIQEVHLVSTNSEINFNFTHWRLKRICLTPQWSSCLYPYIKYPSG